MRYTTFKFRFICICFVFIILITVGGSSVYAKPLWAFFVNGKVVYTADVMYDQRTQRLYIPLRDFAETMGAQVTYNRSERQIFLTQSDFESLATRKVDPWGRLVRESKLPANANHYPYVLKKYTNEIYEMKPPYSRLTTAKNTRQLFADTAFFDKKNLDAAIKQVKNHYQMIFNVDYRKMADPNAWVQQLTAMRAEAGNQAIEIQRVNDYAKWVVRNKIKMKGEANPEPSMIYFTGSEYYVRTPFSFTIEEFIENRQIIFDLAYDWNKLTKKQVYRGFADFAIQIPRTKEWGKSVRIKPDSSLFQNSMFQNNR